MGFESMPKPAQKQDDKEMERKGVEMMTPTERELSVERVMDLAKLPHGGIEKNIELLKGVEEAGSFSHKFSRNILESVFETDKVRDAEAYYFKMKEDKSALSAGRGSVRSKGLFGDWNKKSYYQLNGKTVTSDDGQAAARIFDLTKSVYEFLQKEKDRGNMSGVVRAEVRTEVEEAAAK